jgi:hypothetical protein
MAGMRSLPPDPKGALVFGPYAVVPPGSYVARFRVRTTGADPGATDRLAITSSDPDHPGEVSVIASREITKNIQAYTFLDLPFTLDKPETVEYTLQYGGKAQTWLDRIEVLNANVTR